MAPQPISMNGSELPKTDDGSNKGPGFRFLRGCARSLMYHIWELDRGDVENHGAAVFGGPTFRCEPCDSRKQYGS